MFIVYSEYIDKDEVVPRVQEFIGYAQTDEEFFEYLKRYKMPDYMVFEEPKNHLPAGSQSFRISNNHTSIYLIAEQLSPLADSKMASFPPEQSATA